MLVLMGVFLGIAFLTKTLDALLVVPALGVAYLYAGPPHLARRLRQLGWAAAAFLGSCGWWVATDPAVAEERPPLHRRKYG